MTFTWWTDQLQCFDTVGWVIWPIKIVPDMTYNVFGGTLNPTLLLKWPRYSTVTDISRMLTLLSDMWLVSVVDQQPAKYSLSADGTSLTVFNVCRDCVGNTTDLQVIQCNASNEHGYSFAAGYLNVLRITFDNYPRRLCRLVWVEFSSQSVCLSVCLSAA